MTTFDEIRTKWELRPIRNCPGRFIIRTSEIDLSAQELLGADALIQTFQVASAKDIVLVARMDEGGLISYRRADGTHLHTLNTADGFARKLRDLGIELAKE